MWSAFSWILLISACMAGGECHVEAVRGFQTQSQCLAAPRLAAGLLGFVKRGRVTYRIQHHCVTVELREA